MRGLGTRLTASNPGSLFRILTKSGTENLGFAEAARQKLERKVWVRGYETTCKHALDMHDVTWHLSRIGVSNLYCLWSHNDSSGDKYELQNKAGAMRSLDVRWTSHKGPKNESKFNSFMLTCLRCLNIVCSNAANVGRAQQLNLSTRTLEWIPILLNLYYLPRISSYSTGNYCCSPSSVNACLSRPKKETVRNFEFLGISLCVTFNTQLSVPDFVSFPFRILSLLRDKIWNGKPGFKASRCAIESAIYWVNTILSSVYNTVIILIER